MSGEAASRATESLANASADPTWEAHTAANRHAAMMKNVKGRARLSENPAPFVASRAEPCPAASREPGMNAAKQGREPSLLAGNE